MKTFRDFGIDADMHASGEQLSICPQCSHTRKKRTVKCLSANASDGVWHCHHCGWSGSLKDGTRETELHWQKPAYRKPSPPRPQKIDGMEKWFLDRGISKRTLKRNKIHGTTVYMPQVEDHVNAIAFPYFREGELVNTKYRDGSKNFRMEAGAERILYGIDDMADLVVIVEGEIDKLSIEEAGIASCVSVPDGAPAVTAKDYSSKFTFLETAEEQLSRVKKFVIAVDSDDPGVKLEDELSRRLGRERCSRVKWPKDCKDANEVLIGYGAAKLREIIDAAEPYPVEGAFTTLDLSDKITHLYRNGWEKGHSTGWHGVDEYYTVRPGEFTVVTGIPNSGKSNLIDAMLVNLALHHGWHFALFSPENQPLEDHMARMMEKYAGLPFGHGPSQRMSESEKDEAEKWVSEHFTWVLPNDDSDWTLDNILDIAKQLVFRCGIRGLVIDPWNELEHLRPSGMSETEYISVFLKRVRNFGRRYGVHVWIVAHPSKLYRDKDGNYPVPTPYDISGSAHWRNKADNCLTIWRDFNQSGGMIEVHIQKVRFRQVGRIGMAELKYEHLTATYMDAMNTGAR